MADLADIAFDSEQQHLEHAFTILRSRDAAPRPVGHCHFCGSTEGMAGRLFCDTDCAADWEYQDALRRRIWA